MRTCRDAPTWESQTFYVDLIAGKLECGKTEVTERGSEAGKNDKAR
jgi:hypothetical protein